MGTLLRRFATKVVFVWLVLAVLGLAEPIPARSATTPLLGVATTYGLLATTFTNTSVTTINGDVGFTVAPTIPPLGTHTNYGAGTVYTSAGTDQATAASALGAQGCTFTWPAAVDLGTDPTHGTVGVFTPGVYCSAGAMTITSSITLSGSGTYIFRPTGALNTTAGISVNLSGASACDVFWTPAGATTLGGTTSFVGTAIQTTDVTLGAGSTWTGRVLAYNAAVTTDTNTITVPTCPSILHIVKQVVNNSGGVATVSSFQLHVKAAGTDVVGSPAAGAASPGTSYSLNPGTYVVSEDANSGYAHSFSGDCDSSGTVVLTSGGEKTCTITNDDIAPATITVVKTVINDSGGTKTVAGFPLFVNATSVISGVTNTFPAPAAYDVSETVDASYTQTFSGDCNASGHIALSPGNNKVCIVTNDDIGVPVVPPVPPLIELVKVPNPLALPGGPGLVTYTYTLRNIGTVPVSNISLVGDTCSPITLVAGDLDSDSRLDVAETWTYRCTTTLTATHTNIVVATGVANNLTATDIASATVVVGAATVPPLIHVTKVPNHLTLSAGGDVRYALRVSNLGTVAISNIQVTDKTCRPLTYSSGDTNTNSLLDPTETWLYSCQATLSKTTINTAVVSGRGHTLTARDFAIATVVVASASPGLPNTGRHGDEHLATWMGIQGAGALVLVWAFASVILNRRSFRHISSSHKARLVSQHRRPR